MTPLIITRQGVVHRWDCTRKPPIRAAQPKRHPRIPWEPIAEHAVLDLVAYPRVKLCSWCKPGFDLAQRRATRDDEWKLFI